MNRILEIACFNLPSALIAQVSGADRIELCEHYLEGGLTPSYQLIQEARQKIQIPLHVIIRPKAGNFHYTAAELKKMESDILFCKEHQVEGIVFGALQKDNSIDKAVCKQLIELAGPLAVTFHRAIDACPDKDAAFRDLIELGVERVLTSGGKGTAEENITELKRLQAEFGHKLVIMPGGGVRSSNLKNILKSNCREVHSAAITNATEIADAEEIRQLKQLLSQQHSM